MLARIPVVRTVVPPHDVAEGDRPWSAWEAETRLRQYAGVEAEQVPEGAWPKFAEGFAWYDADAAAAGYRFPHHDVMDGQLVLSRAGLLEAGAQAMNEQVMVAIPEGDRAGVLEHLGQHYRALGMVPPWDAQSEGERDVARPYANEHAARQSDPDRYSRFRRGHPDEFPDGVDAIYGFLEDGGSEIQSVRFDAEKWSAANARQWLKDHEMKSGLEEAKPMSRVARVVCASEAHRVIYAVIAEPDVGDSYDNHIPADVIARAAHDFLERYAHGQARSIEDHRVHLEGWPDGVDAIVSAPEGEYVVEEVRFDRNAGWDEARAQGWLNEHEFERGVIDDGPETLDLVESAIAPVDMETMHGVKLPAKLAAGTWYVGARMSPKQWAEREDFTGPSLGGRALQLDHAEAHPAAGPSLGGRALHA